MKFALEHLLGKPREQQWCRLCGQSEGTHNRYDGDHTICLSEEEVNTWDEQQAERDAMKEQAEIEADLQAEFAFELAMEQAGENDDE